MTLTTDKELVKRIKKGSQNAFKELYLKYSDLVFAFILRQLDNNREAASDIWQETWISAVEKIPDFHYKSSVFTWFCAIAKNKVSDYYRLKKSKVEDISIIFITGVFFGLFHVFGYYEYSYETGFTTDAPLMLNVVVQKVLLNISYGLLLGYIRYKIKKLYPSFLIHSFGNIILGH